MDCGNTYDIICMDFDHRPDEKKLGSIFSFWKDEEKFWAEVTKCDVICSNCHRLRTKMRGQCHKGKESWSDKAIATRKSPEYWARQIMLRSPDPFGEGWMGLGGWFPRARRAFNLYVQQNPKFHWLYKPWEMKF